MQSMPSARFVGACVGLLLLAIAGRARADEAESREEWLRNLDFRSPIRLGAGYSKIYHSNVIATGFEDEFNAIRLSDAAHFHVVFGMSGWSAKGLFERDPARRSFLGTSFGGGVNVRVGRPLFSLSAAVGPGWSGNNDGLVPDGLGWGTHAIAFPLYVSMRQAIECDKGWFSTYVLSGLNVWGEARQDFFGSLRGMTVAAGGGIDLGRHFLMPILHEVFTGRCGL
jgi:hypothetical protein